LEDEHFVCYVVTWRKSAMFNIKLIAGST